MEERRPVYNGYEEKYVNGTELKRMFVNKYYTTGRHHSVVIGITIPEYFDYLGISDNQVYRIFVNEAFCKVMRADADHEISFFGHTLIDQAKLSNSPKEIKLEKECAVCKSDMEFKIGKYGAFLGCSNYPNCKYTVKIPIIGNLKPNFHGYKISD